MNPSVNIVASILFLAVSGVAARADSVPAGMARIPGGTFVPLYGDTKEPRKVAPFFLDVDQVTNARYLEFVRAFPEWRRSAVRKVFADANYLRHWAGDLDPGSAGLESPVTHISWFAATAYCRQAGKRLPTADEWEFAALADETRADATADDAFTRRILDWYGRPTPAVLPPVTEAPVNLHGIRGLHGVVWEWVRDFNNMMVTGESRGNSELERSLYCAGGALGATDVRNYAAFMRFAFRSSLKGNYAVANLGFRGAKDIEIHRRNHEGPVGQGGAGDRSYMSYKSYMTYPTYESHGAAAYRQQRCARTHPPESPQ